MKLGYNSFKNYLPTSCQIKLWNFLLQLETTKKSLNFLSESYIFHRHRVKKQKQIDDKSADRDDPSSTFRLHVVKFGPNVTQEKWQWLAKTTASSK